MKLVNLALVSLMVVGGVVATGCASKSEGSGGDSTTLGTSESLLVADNEESSDVDETAEVGVEEPLSGADPSAPGAPAEGTDDADLANKLKTNPAKWFKPGCIVSSVNGNGATHVFTNCTGPYGFVDFNGTVTTTFVRGAGSLTITYEASGFKANGASITGKRVVVFTKNGSVITKHRTGTWAGTTKKGKELSHTADFTVTYDLATKCITRDGTAHTTIAGRELSRTITGFKRCGIGSGGCPESGKIELSRTKGGDTATLTIQFLGGRDYTITGPRGRTATLELACRE